MTMMPRQLHAHTFTAHATRQPKSLSTTTCIRHYSVHFLIPFDTPPAGSMLSTHGVLEPLADTILQHRPDTRAAHERAGKPAATLALQPWSAAVKLRPPRQTTAGKPPDLKTPFGLSEAEHQPHIQLCACLQLSKAVSHQECIICTSCELLTASGQHPCPRSLPGPSGH